MYVTNAYYYYTRSTVLPTTYPHSWAFWDSLLLRSVQTVLSLREIYTTATKNSWTRRSWEEENSSHCGSEGGEGGGEGGREGGRKRLWKEYLTSPTKVLAAKSNSSHVCTRVCPSAFAEWPRPSQRRSTAVDPAGQVPRYWTDRIDIQH